MNSARRVGGTPHSEPLEPRRLLTAVISHGFDPNVIPHEFAYTFDTSVEDSLHDEDLSVENLSANDRLIHGLAWAYLARLEQLGVDRRSAGGV